MAGRVGFLVAAGAGPALARASGCHPPASNLGVVVMVVVAVGNTLTLTPELVRPNSQAWISTVCGRILASFVGAGGGPLSEHTVGMGAQTDRPSLFSWMVSQPIPPRWIVRES